MGELFCSTDAQTPAAYAGLFMRRYNIICLTDLLDYLLCSYSQHFRSATAKSRHALMYSYKCLCLLLDVSLNICARRAYLDALFCTRQLQWWMHAYPAVARCIAVYCSMCLQSLLGVFPPISLSLAWCQSVRPCFSLWMSLIVFLYVSLNLLTMSLSLPVRFLLVCLNQSIDRSQPHYL